MSEKTIIVDVDGVIARKDHGGNYERAGPLSYGISQINALKELGYKIVLFTARYGDREQGCMQRQYNRGYLELVTWLQKHGVKYDEVWMGKPAGVMYIDDKAARVNSDNADGWQQIWDEVDNLDGRDKYGNVIDN